MRRNLISILLGVFILAGCNLISSEEITPIPTPDIPQTEILSPSNNRQVVEGTEFDIDIVAHDENPGIARVELFIDGESINEASPVDDEIVPVFRVTMNWLAQGIGLHVIEAAAYRPDGTRGDAAVINIEVLPRQ